MTHTVTPPAEKKTYRSPQRKLVVFFEKSRNQWKTKCLETKAALRRIKNRATWLEQSRDQWKARAQALARRIQALEAQTAKQQHEIDTLKKSPAPQPPLRSANHLYPASASSSVWGRANPGVSHLCALLHHQPSWGGSSL